MSAGERTPELAILVLVVALVAGALLVGGGADRAGSTSGSEAAVVSPQRIELIEQRVERLRGLRFKRPVPVAVISPAEARRAGLAELDRTQPPAERRAGEELLKLLGLLPAGADMRRIESAIFAEQVAGYYDPRRGRLALVRGAGVDDITLAHELAHALEDQHFDLERFGDGPGDDAATAEQALVEGTATVVMQRYAARWPTGAPLGDALGGLSQTLGGTPLPAYVMRSLIFPYLQGEQFVRALLQASGGDWRLVDVALRARPPVTTAEILDPSRWLEAERPVAVALGGGGALRAAGFRRLTGSTLGEEDLAALLAPQSSAVVARRLSDGWAGGRYALWRRGALDDEVDRGCASPCRKRAVVQLAIVMERAGQARVLATALGRWADSLPRGSVVAVRVGGPARATVRVVLAPHARLASRLVQFP